MAKRWTEEEVEYLRSASTEISSAEIAKHLGRTLCGVRTKAKNLGIVLAVAVMSDGSLRRRWSRREVSALYGCADTMTLDMAAKKLGRSRNAVRRKAAKLGLSFKEGRLRIKDVADIIGVSQNTICRRRDRLGLKFRCSSQNGRCGTMRGPVGDDIVAIARDILDNPPKGRGGVSAKRLREVIDQYSGWE